jgi:hypothetical protein
MAKRNDRRTMCVVSGLTGIALLFCFQTLSPLFCQDWIVVRGKMVCVDQRNKEIRCEAGQIKKGLITDSGEIFPLKLDKKVITLNQEKRFQTDLFQLTLQKPTGLPAYEVLKAQLIRQGHVYDYYYYCPVCNITSFTLGPCMCCQGEMEYHDRESKQNDKEDEFRKKE